jgi:hypothetical protein
MACNQRGRANRTDTLDRSSIDRGTEAASPDHAQPAAITDALIRIGKMSGVSLFDQFRGMQQLKRDWIIDPCVHEISPILKEVHSD